MFCVVFASLLLPASQLFASSNIPGNPLHELPLKISRIKTSRGTNNKVGRGHIAPFICHEYCYYYYFGSEFQWEKNCLLPGFANKVGTSVYDGSLKIYNWCLLQHFMHQNNMIQEFSQAHCTSSLIFWFEIALKSCLYSVFFNMVRLCFKSQATPNSQILIF